MARRRRTTVRRRPRRSTRRRVTRPTRSIALRRYVRNNVHHFKRSVNFVPIVTSAVSGNAFYGFSAALLDLPSSAEFGALYDHYKITGIKLSIIWRSTVLSAIETVNNAGVGAPYMYWIIDRDDSVAPTTVDQLREYSRARLFEFDTGKRRFTTYWKPNILNEVAGPSTGYSPVFNRWIDVTYNQIPHYGFKAAIEVPSVGLSTVMYFDVEATYYLTMRDPR